MSSGSLKTKMFHHASPSKQTALYFRKQQRFVYLHVHEVFSEIRSPRLPLCLVTFKHFGTMPNILPIGASTILSWRQDRSNVFIIVLLITRFPPDAPPYISIKIECVLLPGSISCMATSHCASSSSITSEKWQTSSHSGGRPSSSAVKIGPMSSPTSVHDRNTVSSTHLLTNL